jgi:hypothetical protein
MTTFDSETTNLLDSRNSGKSSCEISNLCHDRRASSPKRLAGWEELALVQGSSRLGGNGRKRLCEISNLCHNRRASNPVRPARREELALVQRGCLVLDVPV